MRKRNFQLMGKITMTRYTELTYLHLQWLAVVSIAVLYNIIFVVGRAVFWEINRNAPALWWTLDYLCDFIYLIDTLVHCHEGELIFYLN